MTTDPTRSDAAVDTKLSSLAFSASPTTDRTADRTADLATWLDTTERIITNGDADFPSLEDLVVIECRVIKLESVVESLTDRLDEMDAVTRAMRGYLGGVRAVNEDIECRTNTILAKTESLGSGLVDEAVSPALSRSTDVPTSEAASHAGRTTDGGDGSGPQRATETGLGTGTATPSPESRTVPDSDAPTNSRGDSADHGLTVRLRGTL